MASLTQAQTEDYKTRGVLFPFDVLSPGEVRAALDVIARFDAQPPDVRKGLLLSKSTYVSKTLCDICRSPRILDAVETLIGPDILVWGANFFLKEPRSSAYVSWHQDAAYWGLEPADVVTAWVALTPSTRASGCMRVAPGTHLGALAAHKDTWAQDNLLSRGQEIAVDVDASRVVDIELRAGEMSLHHVKLAHNSEPNGADHRRIGFAIRYVGAHVRQVNGARDLAMLVRGSNAAGNFDLEEAASGEMLARNLARHAAFRDASRLVPKAPATTP